MAFSIDQYGALMDAIAAGTTKVVYGDKTVEYRSLTDMLRISVIMKAELFPDSEPVRRKYAEHSKGINPTYPDWSNEHLR